MGSCKEDNIEAELYLMIGMAQFGTYFTTKILSRVYTVQRVHVLGAGKAIPSFLRVDKESIG